MLTCVSPPLLIAALDVHYRDRTAVAASVVFRGWTAHAPVLEHRVTIDSVAPYRSGEFYRRELDCLLKVLRATTVQPGLIIIDGYVWLDPAGRAGLGAHLFNALGASIPIVGVAKTRFHSASSAVAICRGRSRSPLFITAAGTSVSEAAQCVQQMHGPHRIPTLLKRVDRLSRQS
jgi:deoxyribonuclease V